MSWLRRLSRDRNSKYEQNFDDFSPPNESGKPPSSYRPHTSYGDGTQAATFKDSQFPTDSTPSKDMLRHSAHYDSQPYSGGQQYTTPPRMTNGNGNGNGLGQGASSPQAAAPDPLVWAFNEAIKPYIDQISGLKAELVNARAAVQHLEDERAALHNWIDKRGLRPDLPPSLASTLPSSSVAASTLSTQLDRKMTMLNYSLHHLADSAPETLPTLTVTSTLSTLLPAIAHLATLPTGPAFAFETLIKLAGNLNSHSTGEETEADRANIASFYDTLDEAMAGVIGKRVVQVSEGEDDWDVAKDVKRLDKTGVFLRKEMGVRNYFVKSLDIMKGEGGEMGMGMGMGVGSGEGLTRYAPESP